MMALLPLIVFDDVEAWTVTRLSTLLTARPESYAADVLVATEVPTPRASRMVIVRRDGGGRLDQVREAPRLGINVWAESDVEAADLARLTSALLWCSPDGDPVSRVTITGGPYRVVSDTPEFRYYFTAELVSKGRNL